MGTVHSQIQILRSENHSRNSGITLKSDSVLTEPYMFQFVHDNFLLIGETGAYFSLINCRL